MRPNPKFKPQSLAESKAAQNADPTKAVKQVETSHNERKVKNPKKLPPLDYKINSSESKYVLTHQI